MIVSALLTVSRRMRAWAVQRLRRKTALRLNTPRSVMFIRRNGKNVFKFK